MDDLSKRSTLEVVEHHNKALNSGNLEETLLDYKEDSFIMTPGGLVSGLKAIREFFDANIKGHLPPETKMKYHTVTSNGKLGYTRWEATSPYVTYLMGSDTFIVENGKIVMQSFCGYTG
jgi:hypothetical protein